MKICTFFGHRDCPSNMKGLIRAAILEIIQYGVDLFYVGHQGQFDAIGLSLLRELKANGLNFDYAVVLAYVPGSRKEDPFAEEWETLLPEGIEMVHPRYAISWRNDWLLKHSECVIAYVDRPWGGAAKYLEKAERQSKKLIHIKTSPIR